MLIYIDESLALNELKQRAMEYENTGVDFTQTDFVSIGRACRSHSEWVENVQSLSAELNAALERKHTTLLACRFPRQAYDGAI